MDIHPSNRSPAAHATGMRHRPVPAMRTPSPVGSFSETDSDIFARPIGHGIRLDPVPPALCSLIKSPRGQAVLGGATGLLTASMLALHRTGACEHNCSVPMASHVTLSAAALVAAYAHGALDRAPLGDPEHLSLWRAVGLGSSVAIVGVDQALAHYALPRLLAPQLSYAPAVALRLGQAIANTLTLQVSTTEVVRNMPRWDANVLLVAQLNIAGLLAQAVVGHALTFFAHAALADCTAQQDILPAWSNLLHAKTGAGGTSIVLGGLVLAMMGFARPGRSEGIPALAPYVAIFCGLQLALVSVHKG